ncbi:MAG: hypothetical protein ACKO96_05140 [Flammeovirgaceae bacterium]
MSQELTDYVNAVRNEDCKRVTLQANATSTIAGGEYVVPYAGEWRFTAWGTLGMAKPSVQKKKGANFITAVDATTGNIAEIATSGEELSITLAENDTIRGATTVAGGGTSYTSEITYIGNN